MTHLKKISGLLILILLLTACGESTQVSTNFASSVASPIPPKRTSVSKAELLYPSAKWLTEKDIWPDGIPVGREQPLFGAFVTSDTLQQVLDFYEKKVISLGFGYEPEYSCLEPGSCKEIYGLDADLMECTPDHTVCGSTYQIQFLLLSSTATSKDDKNGFIPETLYSLAKTGQTLVVFGGGPYHPFQPPPTNTTTAALVTSTPAPKP